MGLGLGLGERVVDAGSAACAAAVAGRLARASAQETSRLPWRELAQIPDPVEISTTAATGRVAGWLSRERPSGDVRQVGGQSARSPNLQGLKAHSMPAQRAALGNGISDRSEGCKPAP